MMESSSASSTRCYRRPESTPLPLQTSILYKGERFRMAVVYPTLHAVKCDYGALLPQASSRIVFVWFHDSLVAHDLADIEDRQSHRACDEDG